MNITNLIALFSFLISAIALFYSLVSNTNRFELADQYRKDLLIWYQDTIYILLKIRGQVSAGTFDWRKIDLLFTLSAQIENGGFFLPNYQTTKGPNEPLAYQGNGIPH